MSIKAQGLRVVLGRGRSQTEILHGVDVEVPAGSTVCLVGESGSGKSVLLKSLLGILPDLPGVVSGQVWWNGNDPHGEDLLAGLRESAVHSQTGEWSVDPGWVTTYRGRMSNLWGTKLGYMAQHGRLALDPTRPVGAALTHAARLGAERMSRSGVVGRVLEILARLRFDSPEAVMGLYPSQLSGGMAQRVVIAQVLLGGATTLLADEPTTGLDPDSQDALLDLLGELRTQQRISSLLLVTHDLGVARRLADFVCVMEKGIIVEAVPANKFFGGDGPAHKTSQTLLHEFYRLEGRSRASKVKGGTPVLEARHLSHSYRVRPGLKLSTPTKQVLSDVNLSLAPGEIVGLIGPSGCGKTTLAGVLARLMRPTAGEIYLEGENLLLLSGSELRKRRRQFQLLFQQPEAAIHPRMRVEEALMETAQHVLNLPLLEARSLVSGVLEQVGLGHRRRAYPAHLSGGERRRVGLAKVLMLRPRVLIVDEPTAGVDASLRAGILAMLAELATGQNPTSILLISHDRAVIRHIADRALSLTAGRLASAEHIWEGVMYPDAHGEKL